VAELILHVSKEKLCVRIQLHTTFAASSASLFVFVLPLLPQMHTRVM
jgi:hypothetical protein